MLSWSDLNVAGSMTTTSHGAAKPTNPMLLTCFWSGTTYNLIKQYGRWIGTIYGCSYFIYYHIKQHGELYLYDIVHRLVYPLGARLLRSASKVPRRAHMREGHRPAYGAKGTGR